MDLSEKTPVSVKNKEMQGNARLSEVLRGIRAAERDAVEELDRLLAPGIRLMIRRRDSHHDAQLEAQSVIEAAVREIQADLSLDAAAVVRLVRQLVQRRFPANGRPVATPGNWEPGLVGRGVDVAGKVLEQMSLIDREALRRCYVLGETKESILDGLNMSAERYRVIKSRARAAFNAEIPQKLNVA